MRGWSVNTHTRLLTCVMVLALLGCGAIAGVRGEGKPPRSFQAIARATTSEAGGLVVLYNGRCYRKVNYKATKIEKILKPRAWLATNQTQLAALWRAVGAPGPVPAVDLSAYAVLGTSFLGWTCHDEIVAAEVDSEGRLLLRMAALYDDCILLHSPSAQVVAVPRRLLPGRLTWFTVDDEQQPLYPYTFKVPEAAPAPSTPPKDSGAGASSLERPSIAAPRGVVALPPPGTLALRSLDDGSEVWVVHQADGRVAVLAAEYQSETPGIYTRVRWDERFKRFSTAHDVEGRSVHGEAPLEVYTFARLDQGRLAIGEPTRPAPGPIARREDAPTLLGPASERKGDHPRLAVSLPGARQRRAPERCQRL